MADLSHFNGPEVFENFDETAYPEDLQGWGSQHPFFKDIFEFLFPKTIIEVGVWKGVSTIHMLEILTDMEIEPLVWCVDPWTGSSEHYTATEHRALFDKVDGFPDIYQRFLSNVKRSGYSQFVRPLPLPSSQAAIVFKKNQIKADFIYIDGAHDYRSVRADAEDYFELLNDDGFMMFDDYCQGDVTQAVNEFAAKVDLPIYTSHGKAIMPRDKTIRVQMDVVSFSR